MHESEDGKIRQGDRLKVDELVDYVNAVGKRGIYDEYHCLNTVSPQGTFNASRYVSAYTMCNFHIKWTWLGEV